LPPLLPIADGSMRGIVLPLTALLVGDAVAHGEFHRFCGVAMTDKDIPALGAAAPVAGADKVWHYNWAETTRGTPDGMGFVPMVKAPNWNAFDLPLPRGDTTVKGWNEPDDAGQAGSDAHLRNSPADFAQAYTQQMMVARGKGYTEFVSPAMAQDTCWLDHFLKACEYTSGCKDMVTYLGMHHYHNDCNSYSADPGSMGFRDDLSYVLTYYRLMQKYNARGFKIQGLVFDELGCLGANDEAAQTQYMRAFFEGTIVKVMHGDREVIKKIEGTQWIMPKGPDAHTVGKYYVGMCRAEAGGPQAGEDAVRAIQSLTTVAWFGLDNQNTNLLFRGRGLSALGWRYFHACSSVDTAIQPHSVMV